MKRLLDIVVAAVAIVALSPALAIVAILIAWRLGSPVLFKQTRPGTNGKPFTLYKFRTMSIDHGSDGNPLPDAQRLTRLGRFLRASSLDELPELWNVLVGDMSLVGPRPLLMEYLPLYTPEQARRHDVRPGITGWAQVNGRNTLTWDERFALDIWYVENHSVLLDVKILWLTVWYVLRREDINHPGHDTMEPFRGSQKMGGLLIVGASGHGKVVVEAAAGAGGWSSFAFADDRETGLETWHRLPVVGSSKADAALLPEFPDVVVAIGDAATRLRLLREFETAGYAPATVIHPAATVSQSATIGPGSVVLAGGIVNADATLGRGCIVNTNASVDHDCRLGDGVHVCPGASIAGDVTIGERTWIGIGSSVIQGLTIGSDVTVGAGGAVINNLADGVTAVGVPAQPRNARRPSHD